MLITFPRTMLPGCRCTALHQLICFWLSFQVHTLTRVSPCQAEQQSVSPGPGVAAYRFMLEQNLGRTMLQFQVSSKQSLCCSLISPHLTLCQNPHPYINIAMHYGGLTTTVL